MELFLEASSGGLIRGQDREWKVGLERWVANCSRYGPFNAQSGNGCGSKRKFDNLLHDGRFLTSDKALGSGTNEQVEMDADLHCTTVVGPSIFHADLLLDDGISQNFVCCLISFHAPLFFFFFLKE